MDAWVTASLLGAGFQAGRFALQKRLADTGLTPTGATYARFLWSAPLALGGVLALAWATGQALPVAPWAFWGYAALGGLAQVLATVATVRLLTMRRFAVGVTVIKTEALLTAAMGFALLGERLAAPALAALSVGVLGLVLLSRPPRIEGAPAVAGGVALGLLAGLLFAVSGVSYRGATLALPEGGALLRAGLTLAATTGLQALAMTLWMGWRGRREIGRVARRWRATAPVGLLSAAGSACWFTGFALQSAALVKGVGQVEILLSLLLGRFAFGEVPSARELVGMALLGASVLALALGS